MLRNIFYILLVGSILFTGCASKTNIQTATVQNEVIDDKTSEFEDEFGSEFEDEVQDDDLLYGYNVAMTNFNDKFYTYVLNPVASGYSKVIPKGTRNGVKNFFHNLMYPIRLVNNLLQGKVINATEETGRFVINTTIGFLGFFDPAKDCFDLDKHNEDFGQTLGYWGVGSGYHIVLPFLGSSNMRDMFSLYPNTIVNPVAYSNEGMELTVYEKLNYASLHQGEYEELKKDSVELYPFLRDIYEQRRDKLIEE